MGLKFIYCRPLNYTLNQNQYVSFRVKDGRGASLNMFLISEINHFITCRTSILCCWKSRKFDAFSYLAMGSNLASPLYKANILIGFSIHPGQTLHTHHLFCKLTRISSLQFNKQIMKRFKVFEIIWKRQFFDQ